MWMLPEKFLKEWTYSQRIRARVTQTRVSVLQKVKETNFSRGRLATVGSTASEAILPQVMNKYNPIPLCKWN